MYQRTKQHGARFVTALVITMALGVSALGQAGAESEGEPVNTIEPVPIQIAGPFTPTPEVPGVTLTTYSGGPVSDLEFALRVDYNERARAIATVGGEFVPLIPGAPAFVNAAFESAFADGVPAGTALIVVVDAYPPEIQAALDDARARWATAGGTDYDMTLSVSCFCLIVPEDPGARVDLEVRNGVVVSAVTENGIVVDPLPSLFRTVEELFDEIQGAIDERAARISVTYHADGYPSDLFIDRVSLMADEEIGYTIHSLTLR